MNKLPWGKIVFEIFNGRSPWIQERSLVSIAAKPQPSSWTQFNVGAFYTDEIMVSGGPESFSGLPGMILGLALPRLNCTWFATKVQLEGYKPGDIAAPAKGKKATNAELKSTLDKSLKDWGKYANRFVWWIMI